MRPSKKVYVVEKQAADPQDISRTVAECVDDVISVWRELDHAAIGQGHWHVGLANALDGTEDPQLSPQIRELWEELGLFELRKQIVQTIRHDVEAGTLSWLGGPSCRSVWDIIVHPTPQQGGLGELVEGQEFEPELEDGEQYFEHVEDEFAEIAHVADTCEDTPLPLGAGVDQADPEPLPAEPGVDEAEDDSCRKQPPAPPDDAAADDGDDDAT